MSNTIIKTVFNSIGKFKNGLATVTTNNGKFGLIDASGKLLSDINFDKILPFDNNHITRVKRDGKIGLLSTKGKLVLDTIYDSVKFFDDINISLLIVEKDGKFGVIATTLKEIIVPIIYDNITKLKIDSNIDEIFGIVELGDKKGLVNVQTGEMVIKPIFCSIYYYEQGFVIVRNSEGKKGLINLVNNIKSDIIYDDILPSNSNCKVIRTFIDRKYGALNSLCEIIAYNIYDDICINPRTISVEKDKKFGLIDINTGKIILNLIYDSIAAYLYNRCVAYINKKYYYFNLDNNTMVNEIGFDNTSIIFNSGYDTVCIDKKYGVMDYNNNVLSIDMIYDSITPVKNNDQVLLKVLKDGKYGYVDVNNNVIVDIIYDSAYEGFSEGITVMSKNGEQFIIKLG